MILTGQNELQVGNMIDSEWIKTLLCNLVIGSKVSKLDDLLCSGVTTGWTGVDMATPVFCEVDLVISRNLFKNI